MSSGWIVRPFDHKNAGDQWRDTERTDRCIALIRLQNGNQREAWEATEQGLARGLADLLRAARARHLNPEEREAAESLQRAVESMRKMQGALQEIGGPRFEDARRRLVELESESCRFDADLAARYPVSEGRGYDLERIQRNLREDAAIIGWVRDDPRLEGSKRWGYVIRWVGPVKWVELPAESVEQPIEADADAALSPAAAPVRTPSPGRAATIARFRRIIAERPGAAERTVAVGRAAASGWFTPLLSHLTGVRNLIVIPSGAVLGVPIEALPVDGGVDPDGQVEPDAEDALVKDRFAVTYTPSATIHAWLTESARMERPPWDRPGTTTPKPPETRPDSSHDRLRGRRS